MATCAGPPLIAVKDTLTARPSSARDRGNPPPGLGEASLVSDCIGLPLFEKTPICGQQCQHVVNINNNSTLTH